MANEKQYLSELDFDNQYRPASADMYQEGMVYFHKVKYPEGYVAEEAGIHENLEFDRVQFTEDAFKRLAYLPASSFTEETRTAKEIAESRISETIIKEGQEVPVVAAESNSKKASKKKSE